MTTSAEYFRRAQNAIPGGVNSPVRAFNGVGGTPIYVQRGQGARITTVEGRELLDFCGSWGPLILGHAHPAVVAAVREAAGEGMTFGINTPREVAMAELLRELVPYLEMTRLVSSGTEAVMTALRLARGVTGRAKIIKFEGCYHGHSDSFLVAAGSGLLTGGQASSAGVSPAIAADVFVVPYNDLEAVRRVVTAHGPELACIVVEPIAGNMGLVMPQPGFLAGLRALCTQCGALLIFDEVITGFRLGPTTWGRLCGVTPDLTCLGKIIGGGMPIGALGGSRAIMEHLAPVGKVYQAGTLSGNPVAVAAGLTTLRLLRDENPYPCLAELAASAASGLNALAAAAGIPFTCVGYGSMFTPYFMTGTPQNLTDVKRCDAARYAKFFHALLDRGIYLPPSQFELAFVSAAHTARDIELLLAAAREALHA
jgi:glutamate-1-semialdehyde 2,1-aminomutase